MTLRLCALGEQLRTSLWFIPTVAVVAGGVPASLRLLIDGARCDLAPVDVEAVLEQASLLVTAAERETVEPRDLVPVYRLRAELERRVDSGAGPADPAG